MGYGLEVEMIRLAHERDLLTAPYVFDADSAVAMAEAGADILVPHQGPAAQAIEVAHRMLEAGVDAVGVHLQSDARRADPTLIERHYLDDVARAIFERVGKAAPVQVVGGLSVAQAKRLARAGLRAFVISGNLGQPDTVARYNLPPAEMERLIAGFIAEVSSA